MRWHISLQGMAIQDYAAQTAAANVARVSQVFVHDDGAKRGALEAAMTAAGSDELQPGLLALPPGPPQNPESYSPHPCICRTAITAAGRCALGCCPCRQACRPAAWVLPLQLRLST